MNQKTTLMIAAVLGLSIGAWTYQGIAQQEPRRGAAERAGERLDKLLGDVREGFRDLSSEVQTRFARVRSEVEDMGVEARVYGRIHWDQALSESKVAVEITNDRDIILHGEVASAEAKQRAGDLAQSTVGVRKVENRLTIRPADEARPDRETPEN